MITPTIERRRARRFILMSADDSITEKIRAAVPAGWEVVIATDLESLDGWHEVLLYRFLLMDLDELDAFDPLDVIRQVRMQFQINIPVFCFGGDEDVRDEMRLARADRCFERNELMEMLPRYFDQYGWA